jgi:hypothetical protein
MRKAFSLSRRFHPKNVGLLAVVSRISRFSTKSEIRAANVSDRIAKDAPRKRRVRPPTT